MNVAEVDEVLGQAHASGTGIVAREPFAGGAIFSDSDFSSTQAIGVSSAQSALQFLLGRPEIGVVLAGMSSRRHLEENLGALEGLQT